DGVVRSHGRTTVNGSVTTGTAPGSWPAGNTWLMIERIGEMLRTSVSSDGAAYQEVSRYILGSLPGSLHVGLWSAGGGGSTNGRGEFSELSIQSEPIVVSQDFSDW